MELPSGSRLSRYRIDERLGAGGMGVVYRAFDTRLERWVALKVLRAGEVTAAARERFVREAKAASALNHHHIVTVFDIEQVETAEGELDLLAMELVDGEPLDRRLARGPLPLVEALELAVEIAGALAAAHQAGIVHRDVKPGNLMVTRDGRVKLLDFGLARLLPSHATETAAATMAGLTASGMLVGTPAYMAPEQAAGRPADARTDVHAVGLVLYEMLAGRRAFARSTPMEELLAAAHEPAPPLSGERLRIPAQLERIVARCLAKEPAERYSSAVELHGELQALRGALFEGPALARWRRRPAVVASLVALALSALAATAWWSVRSGEHREARAALPRLEELVGEHRLMDAYLLARELGPALGEDRELERLLLAATFPVSVTSDPAGAEVRFRDYLGDAGTWETLGPTPLEGMRLPATSLVFRLHKQGFEIAEGAPPCELSTESFTCHFELVPEGSAPPGMVRVAAGHSAGFGGPGLALGPFWIGRHEVTNQEYQAFVDAGGYGDARYWAEPFESDGRILDWEEARAGLVDATGRPGPSTWSFGSYPEGLGDHPVAGVSWYEAAAFARWAGAELPTLHHWFRAASPGIESEILQRSNFGGQGTVPVGSTHAVGPFGTYDMAGNVAEWIWNGDGEGRRYIAGGSFGEASYTYTEPGPVSPFERHGERGLRLARYEEEPPAEVSAAIPLPPPPRLGEDPVSDEVFAALSGVYAYDRGPLAASVDRVDDSFRHFLWERVSFAAAYGGERVPAHLLLPRNAEPPYQVVIYFPASPAEQIASSQSLDGLPWFEFLTRGGRAVLFPVYKNTYERRIPGWDWSPAGRRDVLLQWSKDLGRAIDYLETRSDIDASRIGFYSVSLGAVYAPVLTAVEPRIRAAILLGGGLNPVPLPPEIDPVNFAPRVQAPTLMITGRNDFVRPVPTHQEPLLRLLGVPEAQKRLVQLDGGHIPSDWKAVVRESLDWLDLWLGPVSRDRVARAP